jgi:hypothetical protein
MKTRRRILLVLGALLLAFGGLVTSAVAMLGDVAGFLVVLTAVVAAIAGYLTLIRPWQVRWGATGDEAQRPMPGDGLLGPGAGSTTRAVTIGAPAEQVWPWLAQLGYGKAGWYSYDWLDNDGRRSAGRIRPEWQQLRSGDQILMMPGSGFDVVSVEEGHCFVARAPDGTMSWCLAVEPLDQHSCRLISRWRARWHITPASALWIAVSDPGAFIMERKMLLGIKVRAEHAAQPGLAITVDR